MTERELTTKCIKAMKKYAAERSNGILVVKIHAGPNQPIGLSDIVGCYLGTFFAIEMKLPGKEGKLTERQQQKLDKVEQAGGHASVQTSILGCIGVLKEIEDAPQFD